MTTSLESMLKSAGVILLDGGTGSELERRGYPCRLPLWSAGALLERPSLVREIHADYIAAGADVITTNTFRTNRRTLVRAGQGNRMAEMNRMAAALAREAWTASGRHGLIAWSIAPLEDCYRPDLVPGDADLREEHEEQILMAKTNDADFVKIETMNTVRETATAATIARANGCPFTVSFIAEGDRLLGGETIAEAVRSIEALHPLAILVNCRHPEPLTRALAELQRRTSLPAGIYANGWGGADDVSGWSRKNEGCSVPDFCAWAGKWITMGARMIGGCCGTTPEYIREIAKVRGARPR